MHLLAEEELNFVSITTFELIEINIIMYKNISISNALYVQMDGSAPGMPDGDLITSRDGRILNKF